LPDTATVLVHDSTETVMWRRFTRVPPSTGTGSAKRSLQRSVAVQWKDGVIRRKVRFRDSEPTGALNVPKRFLPSLAVGTIAPSATCLNLRMGRSGSGVEIPCAFGTSGSMRIAAFELRSQSCHYETFQTHVFLTLAQLL
jgi:hypothetical protein